MAHPDDYYCKIVPCDELAEYGYTLFYLRLNATDNRGWNKKDLQELLESFPTSSQVIARAGYEKPDHETWQLYPQEPDAPLTSVGHMFIVVPNDNEAGQKYEHHAAALTSDDKHSTTGVVFSDIAVLQWARLYAMEIAVSATAPN